MKLTPILASVVTLAALVAAPVAHAAFPGADGRIVVHDNRSLYTVDPSTGAHRQLPGDVPGFGGLSVSADGLHIVYSTSHQIHVMGIDGSGDVKLTSSSDDASDEPSFSPDGKHIAFVRDYGIWVMDGNGRNAHSITPDAAFASAYSDPAWSPDGTRIAYTLKQEIGVMSADGSNQRALTSAVRYCDKNTREMMGEEPSWSPNGQLIAFRGPVSCADSLETDVWMVSSAGGGATNLTHDNGTADYDPTFDPAGTRIAFRRDGQLMTMALDGSGIVGVPTGLANEGPDWARAVVLPKLSERAALKRAKHGVRMLISGKVSPKLTGRVRVTIRLGKRTVRSTWVKLRRYSYSTTFVVKKAGSYTVVTTLDAGNGHAGATSPVRKVVVRAKLLR